MRNKTEGEIVEILKTLRNSFGQKAIAHSGKKVISPVKSIQGGWKPNLFNNYPKHEISKVDPWFEYPHVEEKITPRRILHPVDRKPMDLVNKSLQK